MCAPPPSGPLWPIGAAWGPGVKSIYREVGSQSERLVQLLPKRRKTKNNLCSKNESMRVNSNGMGFRYSPVNTSMMIPEMLGHGIISKTMDEKSRRLFYYVFVLMCNNVSNM